MRASFEHLAPNTARVLNVTIKPLCSMPMHAVRHSVGRCVTRPVSRYGEIITQVWRIKAA